VDVKGAMLAPAASCTTDQSGGHLNIRYSQFSPEVVRVVIELGRCVTTGWSTRTTRCGSRSGLTAGSRVVVGLAGHDGFVPGMKRPSPPPRCRLRCQLWPSCLAGPAGRPRAGPAARGYLGQSLDSATIDEVVAQFAGYSGKIDHPGQGHQRRPLNAHITNQRGRGAAGLLASHNLAAVEDPPPGDSSPSESCLAVGTGLTRAAAHRPAPVNYARASSLVGR